MFWTIRLLPRAMALASVVLLLTACGLSIPTDPDGTLERVTDGQLRVGVSHNPPWTDITTGVPQGIEAELVTDFAATQDAEVIWETGGEEQVMTRLREGHLDMMIGGLTDASPWSSHAALTVPYAETTAFDGSTQKHVLAVRTGENAFMVALERHALASDVESMEP